MTTPCKHCGTIITHPPSKSPRYCSMACRRSDQRQVGHCETCGTEFTRKRSEAGRFCSRKCHPGRPRDESKWTTKECPGCGKEFECPSWRDVAHCSRECRTKATNVTTNCPECGVEFTFPQSWPRTFCSRKCYGRARTDLDEGGKVYYGANWQMQRAMAIVRDEGTCVDCDETENLAVHHVVAVRKFAGDWMAANHIDNLVTVCPTHHLARHGGRYGSYVPK